MKQKWLDAAQAVAIAGRGTGARKSFRVGSILLNNGRLVQSCTNSMKTHPILARYSEWPFQHAESACIISHGTEHCNGLELVVARVDRSNQLTMAKPCSVCHQFARDVGISNITYSNWEGGWSCMKVN